MNEMLSNLSMLKDLFKGYSTFLEIGSFYNSPRVGFYHFRIHSADFLIFF